MWQASPRITLSCVYQRQHKDFSNIRLVDWNPGPHSRHQGIERLVGFSSDAAVQQRVGYRVDNEAAVFCHGLPSTTELCGSAEYEQAVAQRFGDFFGALPKR